MYDIEQVELHFQRKIRQLEFRNPLIPVPLLEWIISVTTKFILWAALLGNADSTSYAINLAAGK